MCRRHLLFFIFTCNYGFALTSNRQTRDHPMDHCPSNPCPPYSLDEYLQLTLHIVTVLHLCYMICYVWRSRFFGSKIFQFITDPNFRDSDDPGVYFPCAPVYYTALRKMSNIRGRPILQCGSAGAFWIRQGYRKNLRRCRRQIGARVVWEGVVHLIHV